MMAQRRALTIPFNVDKDNMMENPLKISMPCLSSECGKLERQVSWTAFAGCRRRHRDSQHKNGSMLLDHKHVAMVKLEMARRQPRVILPNVLNTEPGKIYMERIKLSHALGSRRQVSRPRRGSGRCREEPVISRDTRSTQREARNDKNESVTPKCNQKTTSSPAQRSRLRRRSQNVSVEADIEEKDIEEVIIGKDNGDDYKFAEVVDCGLSVSWEPAKDAGSCDEFSPANIKDGWTDPEKEVQHSLKRKMKDRGSPCNGTDSPKRHRESVLRLTREDGRNGGPAPAHACLEDSGDDFESLDRTIVQFTVGAEDQTEVLVPIISPHLGAGDSDGTPRRSLLSSQDNTNTASPSEPIVLSSDDEESSDVSQRCSPAVHTLVTMEDALLRGQSLQKAVSRQQQASELQDMQVLHVVVDVPGSMAVSSIPTIDYSFSMLHCGGHLGHTNGDIKITSHDIIIPLRDADEQVEVMLTLERKDLRRYSVWEQQELEEREFHFEDLEVLPPAAVLLLCVSETAAAAVQQDLLKLCDKQDGPTNAEASPFILLTLRYPVEGMEGALLRSLLDIDCLNSLADENSIHCADRLSCFEEFHTPVLTVDESLELIRRTGLDPHLLFLLGLESSDPGLDTDQDTLLYDTDKNTSPHTQLEDDSQKEEVLELETATEEDGGTQLKKEEDQDQEGEPPSETEKEKPAPVYTLCYRRTKGSYSTSLCKPDASWTKFKHRGLARRLIQFPPPPLKGGITVTMEDLQCLDSGHFLNDVIIDFYLKYLLHKASDTVVQRSHIFSSFFYKQLTRRDNASEGVTTDSCQRQRRHQRVKNWTRHVDIFKKDFLFVPVNQEAHWYLVVICFPGLDEPKSESWSGPNSQTGKSQSRTCEFQEQEVAQGSKSPDNNTETLPSLNHSDSVDKETEKGQEESAKAPPGPVNCTERTCQKKTVSKRPCILIMDSLKRSPHERVFKLLREYLQSEWEVRRGSSQDFSPDQMQSSHCQVPLQDNSSDCGLYLLQYVESFLEDPVVHFDLPLHLQRWFPRHQVRRKRDEIRDLILNLYRSQNLDGGR